MVIEFLIEKLETNWSHIEAELGPDPWADFCAQYRAIVPTLELQGTDALIGQLRHLMASTPCTKRLWRLWREEKNALRISDGAAALRRDRKPNAQQMEQLINRYRDLSAPAAPIAPAAPALPPQISALGALNMPDESNVDQATLIESNQAQMTEFALPHQSKPMQQVVS